MRKNKMRLLQTTNLVTAHLVVIPAEAGIQKLLLDPRASLSSHTVEPEDDKVVGKPLHNLRLQTVRKAFTLIELLVVVAIIGVLAGIVILNVNKSRAKARDSRRVADFGSLKIALMFYKDAHGNLPAEPGGSGAFKQIPTPNNCVNAYAYDSDGNVTSDLDSNCGLTGTKTLQELIDGNFISSIPSDPSYADPNTWTHTPTHSPYYYYAPGTYTPGTIPSTAYLTAHLETYNSSAPYPGSFKRAGGIDSGGVWCNSNPSDTPSDTYCIKIGP